MQQSDNSQSLLGAVRAEVETLERLCADVERSMMAARWDDLSVALAESRRVQHALQNAMHDAASVRDESFDAVVYAKLQWIFAIRENQMGRLRHYQGSISERLQSIARLKSVARRVGIEHSPSRLGTLNQLT